jgi:hypothetical protein
VRACVCVSEGGSVCGSVCMFACAHRLNTHEDKQARSITPTVTFCFMYHAGSGERCGEQRDRFMHSEQGGQIDQTDLLCRVMRRCQRRHNIAISAYLAAVAANAGSRGRLPGHDLKGNTRVPPRPHARVFYLGT